MSWPGPIDQISILIVLPGEISMAIPVCNRKVTKEISSDISIYQTKDIELWEDLWNRVD